MAINGKYSQVIINDKYYFITHFIIIIYSYMLILLLCIMLNIHIYCYQKSCTLSVIHYPF